MKVGAIPVYLHLLREGVDRRRADGPSTLDIGSQENQQLHIHLFIINGHLREMATIVEVVARMQFEQQLVGTISLKYGSENGKVFLFGKDAILHHGLGTEDTGAAVEKSDVAFIHIENMLDKGMGGRFGMLP